MASMVKGQRVRSSDLRKALLEICRAACSLKLEKYESAKEDCSAVIEREVKNVKALFRRAQANAALKVYSWPEAPF